MNYNKLATSGIVNKTKEALIKKGYEVFLVENKYQALEKIKAFIPQGSSVTNGSSVTLEQIGYQEYLKSSNHGWLDLHAKGRSENDKIKRAEIRRQSSLSDYYLGSAHALTESGEFIVASNTGSQLPHIVFTSPNLILVVSTKKIVPTLDDAMKRLEEYVFPLEDKHMQQLYHTGSNINKVVIFHGEPPYLGRKIIFILVKENLGF